LFHFIDISAETLLHILEYSFCTDHYGFEHFVKCCEHWEHQKLFVPIQLCFGTKMSVKLTSGTPEQLYKGVLRQKCFTDLFTDNLKHFI